MVRAKSKAAGRAARAGGTASGLLDVTMLLMRSISAHMRQSDRRLAPAQVGILARIGEQPCTLSELAQHQAVRLPTISRSISMLADRGLVERWTPEHNRRQTMVRLTAAGRDALAGIKREAERHVDSVLAEVSTGERAKVDAAIDILRRELGAPAAVSPTSARAAAPRDGADRNAMRAAVPRTTVRSTAKTSTERSSGARGGDGRGSGARAGGARGGDGRGSGARAGGARAGAGKPGGARAGGVKPSGAGSGGGKTGGSKSSGARTRR
jgi:DNA-binding MarR family transcriptional regulator